MGPPGVVVGPPEVVPSDVGVVGVVVVTDNDDGVVVAEVIVGRVGRVDVVVVV